MKNNRLRDTIWSRVNTSKGYAKVFGHPKTALVFAAFLLVGLSGAASYNLLHGSKESSLAGERVTAAANAGHVAGSIANSKQKPSVQKPQPVSAPTVTTPPAPPVAQPAASGLSDGIVFYNESYLAGKIDKLAAQPVARWFGGWNNPADAGTLVDAAQAQGSVATLALYNIPSRDCGSYSAGGFGSSEGYRSWIRQVAASIGMREAIVILEPDALAGIDCLSAADRDKRYADLADAVSVFGAQTKASVYIDAGNYSWQPADTMITRLQRANVTGATGFSLNVSGFGWTNDSIAYGDKIASRLGKTYVIDTSRNGNGPAPGNEWCNPRGRAIGARPTTTTASHYADAYLWVKVPGESDGECNGGPSAGVWWQEYADELVRNAGL